MRLKSSVKRWMGMAMAKEEFREREPLRFLPDRRLAASALGSLVLLLATFGAGPGPGQPGQDPLASLVEPNARLTIHYIKTVDTELITKGGTGRSWTSFSATTGRDTSPLKYYGFHHKGKYGGLRAAALS